jgi:hypothetical protein
MAVSKNSKKQKTAGERSEQRARTRDNKLRRIEEAITASHSPEHKAYLQKCKEKWVMGTRA